MMELMESNPKVAIVEDLLKRHQMTPVTIENVSGNDMMRQWFLSPHPLQRCLDCAKIHIIVAKTEDSLRIRLDKGLGRQSRSYNVPTRYIMYDPWAYTSVTKDESRIQKIVDLAGQIPLHVWLHVTNGLVPGFNPFSGPFRHRFHWVLNGQGQMSLKEPVFDVSEVGRMQEATTLSELLVRLPRLREWAWYWATFSWGVAGDQVNEQNASTLLQSIQDLWH